MGGKVYFIGAGPGDPELISVKGSRIIAGADLIIFAGSLVNRQVLAGARENCRILDSSGMDLAAITREMIDAARAGKTVARVHTGEPSLYGAVAEQMAILEQENIPFEMVPGVSSAFAAAAALNIEYTLPGISQTLIFTRRSGRTPVPDRESLVSLAGHRASMAIYLSTGMIEDVASDLVAGGYPETTPAAVVHRASWPDEAKIVGTLATIAAQVRNAGFSRQAIILVGDAVGRGLQAASRLYDAGFSHACRSGERKPAAVVAVTRRGRHTAQRLLRSLDGAELFLPLKLKDETPQAPGVHYYDDIRKLIGSVFYDYSRLVLIMAAGIAVRMLAPHVSSKWLDPAVVVIDEAGRHAISLLSGHWGGANDLAERCALVLGGTAVITTESDVAGFPAIDLLVKVLTAGKKPADPKLLRQIQAAVLEGRDVGFYPKALRAFDGMQGHSNLHFFDSVQELYVSGCTAGVIACMQGMQPVEIKDRFYYVPVRDLVVGIGCHRGTEAPEIEAGIEKVLENLGLAASALALVCSIDKKSAEPGLKEYCRQRDVQLKCYSAEEINAVKTPSPPSKHALRVMGAQGVAEPCAILGSRSGKLLAHKVKLKNMTVAVARLALQQLLEQDAV